MHFEYYWSMAKIFKKFNLKLKFLIIPWVDLTSEEQQLRSFTGFMHQQNNVINIVISDMFNKLIKMTNVIWFKCIKADYDLKKDWFSKAFPFSPCPNLFYALQ